MGYSDGSQEFSAELTLHSEVLSPEILQCTPANMVEVHKDTELSKGEVFFSGIQKIPQQTSVYLALR